MLMLNRQLLNSVKSCGSAGACARLKATKLIMHKCSAVRAWHGNEQANFEIEKTKAQWRRRRAGGTATPPPERSLKAL